MYQTQQYDPEYMYLKTLELERIRSYFEIAAAIATIIYVVYRINR